MFDDWLFELGLGKNFPIIFFTGHLISVGRHMTLLWYFGGNSRKTPTFYWRKHYLLDKHYLIRKYEDVIRHCGLFPLKVTYCQSNVQIIWIHYGNIGWEVFKVVDTKLDIFFKGSKKTKNLLESNNGWKNLKIWTFNINFCSLQPYTRYRNVLSWWFLAGNQCRVIIK